MTPSLEQSYRIIPLTKGQVAIVDLSDFDWLNQWKWCAQWDRKTRCFYALRKSEVIGGRRYAITMHRQILGLEFGDKRQGDHIKTGHTLDNRRLNLRVSTQAQNKCNSRRYRNNTSGFKGVIRQKARWQARIRVNGTYIHLGCRDTPEAAHRELYVPASIKYHGEFANDGK